MTITEESVDVRPHRWRLLRAGHGPLALCLHGAGGSADSFGPLMEELSGSLTMVAPDLPGHGATRLGASDRSGLDHMAQDVSALMNALGSRPELTISHSAGAAIALAADASLSPRGHIVINAALNGFEGLAGWLFPALAKGLSATPFASEMLSRHLSQGKRLHALLKATGSDVTDDVMERYLSLVRNPEHVKGTLRMMASWNLQPLLSALPEIKTPVLLIAARGDGTVPISVSKQAEKTLLNARLEVHDGGHLLHEENPALVAKSVTDFMLELGVMKSQSD